MEAPEPGRLDREEVSREHLGTVVADELPPVGPAAARSRRGALACAGSWPRPMWEKTKAELERFALNLPVAPARVLAGETRHDSRRIGSPAGRGRGGRRWKAAHLRRTRSRCQRSRVSGLSSSEYKPDLGSSRLRPASSMRSPGCQPGLPTVRSRARS